jgi:hypothetical protein
MALPLSSNLRVTSVPHMDKRSCGWRLLEAQVGNLTRGSLTMALEKVVMGDVWELSSEP